MGKLKLTYEPIFATFTCSKCGLEHDYYLPTTEKMIPTALGESWACDSCGHEFVADEIVHNYEI